MTSTPLSPDAATEASGVATALASGDPAPSGLSADESRAWEQLKFLYTKGIGYATEMALRPQTLYGLADSPVALAAWMIEHDARRYEDIARAFEGDPVGNLTRGPRQHHAHVGDEHRGFLGSSLLGEQARLLRRQGRLDSGCREPLPSRALPRAGIWTKQAYPKPHLLQRSRQGQPLRGLAGAEPLHDGGACRIPVTALIGAPHQQRMLS